MQEVVPVFTASMVVSVTESERPCQKQQPFHHAQ